MKTKQITENDHTNREFSNSLCYPKDYKRLMRVVSGDEHYDVLIQGGTDMRIREHIAKVAHVLSGKADINELVHSNFLKWDYYYMYYLVDGEFKRGGSEPAMRIYPCKDGRIDFTKLDRDFNVVETGSWDYDQMD